MPGHKSHGMKKTSSKRSRRSAKTTPAVRYLRYEVTNSSNAGTETSHFIDLAKDLSVVNRRLYRQGRDYHVKKITIISSDTPNSGNRISASTIPGSWVSRGAWHRGKNTWDSMNKTASDSLTNDISGTWSDFKVHMTNDARVATLLRPKDNGGNTYDEGEWTKSVFISPDGTTSDDSFSIHMMGDSVGSAGAWTSVSLIKSFGETRATVDNDQPNVPGDVSEDPLVNVFDYGTTIDEVIDQLEADNDNPPYNAADYPGDDGNGPKPQVVQDSTLVDGRATMGGFQALLGLLELEVKSPLPNDVYSILIELAPGKYRGIKADVV